jgi:CTP:molybdopterin cytidylyltransferase MocA
VNAAGLILAAGESRRMGSPKALLRYRDETFLDTLTALLARFCAPVIVVLGAHAAEIRAASTRPATFVVNPDFALGMTTSLQVGLRAVPPEADGVLFTLVDHPAASPATLEALLASTDRRTLVRVPRYRAKRGHPIWFSRPLIPAFLALPAAGPARDVVARHVDRTEYLDLDDPGIVADIDSPEDYRALTGASA